VGVTPERGRLKGIRGGADHLGRKGLGEKMQQLLYCGDAGVRDKIKGGRGGALEETGKG